MRNRAPIGYVVEVDGIDIRLNLLDMHRGQLASHAKGVSAVTETGSLLALDAGSRLLVMKVLGLTFAEPKEAHRAGVGSSTHQSEPLRHLSGIVVGRFVRLGNKLTFISDTLATPPLGAEAFPLAADELGAVLGDHTREPAPIKLGTDLRGGGPVIVGLEKLVSRHVAVLGSSGQGKSCFTAAIVQQLVRLPKSRVVMFDINGEYEDALKLPGLPQDAVRVTDVGGRGFRVPYFALGRSGLHRLLIPSEKTQRPALSFALDSLNCVRWFPETRGVGLADDTQAYLFDDCRPAGAAAAETRVRRLRDRSAQLVGSWPSMSALACLVAESYGLAPYSRAGVNGVERNAFNYSNVAPLINRIHRFVEDSMFTDVVSVDGGPASAEPLDWRTESSGLVDKIFGGTEVPWRVHIVNLRRVTHDLAPFVLGSLLELYAYELFRRGQEGKIATLLVLEEAHHYLRSVGAAEESTENSLAYERLAKEGRKFGLALWLSTQRPSEISPTVLSQCNNWVSFRLTSQKDIAAIEAASEWADRREVKRIAGLSRQNAIVFGGALSIPTLLRAETASPTPRSEEGAFDRWAESETAPSRPIP
jgi:hypothetical protein